MLPAKRAREGNADIMAEEAVFNDALATEANTGEGSNSLDRKNVFVKYLPPDVNDVMLHALFSKHGTILSAKVMIDHATGSSRGFGFVRFSEDSEAASAIQEMNGLQLQNKTLLCKLANAPKATSAQVTTDPNLYVKALPSSVDDEKLREIFARFGEVTDCKVMMDMKTGRSKQIAFVRFAAVDAAQRAVDELNNKRLDDRSAPLVVRFAETPEQRQQRKSRRRQRRNSNGSGGQRIVPMQTPFGATMQAAPHGYFPMEHMFYPQMMYQSMNHIGPGAPFHAGMSPAPLVPPLIPPQAAQAMSRQAEPARTRSNDQKNTQG